MAWTYRYLSLADVAKVKADAVKAPPPLVPDAALLKAWECDLAAHEAWRDKVKGADKKLHEDAIAVLEAALAAGQIR